MFHRDYILPPDSYVRIEADPVGSCGYGSESLEYLIDFSRCLVKWSGYLRISHEDMTRAEKRALKLFGDIRNGRTCAKETSEYRGNPAAGELEAITVIPSNDRKG